MASRKKIKQQPKSADKEPVIYYVNQTTSGDKDLKFAILRLDAAMVAYFLRLMAAATRYKRREPSLREMSFFLSVVTYCPAFTAYDGDWWMELLQNDDATARGITDALDQDEWGRLPQEYQPPDAASRVECEMLHVTEESVAFSCYPKHGSSEEEVETTRFFKPELLAVARRLRKLRDKT